MSVFKVITVMIWKFKMEKLLRINKMINHKFLVINLIKIRKNKKARNLQINVQKTVIQI